MDVNAGRRSLVVLAVGAFLVLLGVLMLNSRGGSEGGAEDAAVPETSTEDDLGAVTSAEPLDPLSVYDPVRAGEEPPRTYRQLLRRDQIEPVYDPTFTDAAGVDWPDEMLVIGVEGVVTAKAYPVTHLNSHEMVIDEIDGDPILVSW